MSSGPFSVSLSNFLRIHDLTCAPRLVKVMRYKLLSMTVSDSPVACLTTVGEEAPDLFAAAVVAGGGGGAVGIVACCCCCCGGGGVGKYFLSSGCAAMIKRNVTRKIRSSRPSPPGCC